MTVIGVERLGARSASEVAARSWTSLDRPLRHRAELSIAEIADDAVLLGAYQRGASVASLEAHTPLFRRGSGGPAVRVGPGSVHVLLLLETPAALAPCSSDKLVNRYVRPLLAALTRVGAQANFFGRDWISVQKRPAAWVGFAHSTTTGRAAVEAVIAVATPFVVGDRASFLGKEPGTLTSITGRDLTVRRVADAIAEAYPAAYALEAMAAEPGEAHISAAPSDLRADPPWTATLEEAIGPISSGRDRAGVLRVGGDLLVSREAIATLEDGLASLAPHAPESEIARLVEVAFTAPDVAVHGIRSRGSIASVIARARALQTEA